jgi:virulence-associated protein VagC
MCFRPISTPVERMTKTELSMNRRSQAALLPRELRSSGDQVRVRRFGFGGLLEPTDVDVDTWFEALDRFEEPFMADGREQPRSPIRSGLR